MSYPQFDLLNMKTNNDYENFGGWFKKIFKVPKFIKKIIPKPLRKLKPLKLATLPFTLPLAAVGILKPKDIDPGVGGSAIRGLVKTYKIGGIIAGAIVAAPVVASVVGSGGTVAMGGLKWFGGKLMSIPNSVAEMLKGKGFPDPNLAPMEKILDAAMQVGAITQPMLDQVFTQTNTPYPQRPIVKPPIYYPQPSSVYPQRTRIEREYFAREDPIQAGMIPTTGMNTNTMLLMGGLGLVAVLMTQRR